MLVVSRSTWRPAGGQQRRLCRLHCFQQTLPTGTENFFRRSQSWCSCCAGGGRGRAERSEALLAWEEMCGVGIDGAPHR